MKFVICSVLRRAATVNDIAADRQGRVPFAPGFVAGAYPGAPLAAHVHSGPDAGPASRSASKFASARKDALPSRK